MDSSANLIGNDQVLLELKPNINFYIYYGFGLLLNLIIIALGAYAIKYFSAILMAEGSPMADNLQLLEVFIRAAWVILLVLGLYFLTSALGNLKPVFRKYIFTEHKIIILHTLINVDQIMIPYNKIINAEVRAGITYQLFSLAILKLYLHADGATVNQNIITIFGLSRPQVNRAAEIISNHMDR